MYLPSQFAEPRLEELHRIVRDHSLGMLVRNTSAGMGADYLPFLLDADQGSHGVLIAHVARANSVDEKFVRGVVARLTRQHEADQPQPWKMGDAPADYLTEQLSHIVGIEIRLIRLDGKRKLNQHHEQRDREGAIQGLEARGNHCLAQAMRDTAKRCRSR